MESARGSRSVRIERKKAGGGDYQSLGISVKGGCEHGIPIVVSSVEKNGPAGQYFIIIIIIIICKNWDFSNVY